MGFHPIVNLHQPLVLLPLEVLLGEVDEVHCGLGRDEGVLVEVVDVLGAPLVHARAHLLARLQPVHHLVYGFELLLHLLLHDGCGRAGGILLHGVQLVVHELQILDAQLRGDDLNVLNGVHAVLHMDDFGIFKRTHDVDDAIHGLNVRQEVVPKPRTVRRAFDEAGDVDNLEVGADDALGLILFHEPFKAVVRHADARRVGFNCAEREVLGGNAALGEAVVQSAFSHIGHTHNAHLQVS
mmetsp:Transcript_35449/g.59741  ORF Transcript_35449/g.59741 Transcript_35449/m.59741 type:complete len:239 (-) Transcript_35449:146-862(-)